MGEGLCIPAVLAPPAGRGLLLAGAATVGRALVGCTRLRSRQSPRVPVGILLAPPQAALLPGTCLCPCAVAVALLLLTGSPLRGSPGPRVPPPADRAGAPGGSGTRLQPIGSPSGD